MQRSLSQFLLLFFLFSFFASQAVAQTVVNLALNRAVTVSSYEDAAAYPASAVTDGNPNTRWSSRFNHDPEWVYVDLGSIISFERVKLSWEAAYGKDYLLQISNNAASWTTIRTVTGNTAVDNDFPVLHATARYIRVYGTARGLNTYGYSLYEISVYNTSNLAFQKPATASSSLGGNTTDRAFDEKSNTRWESTHGQDPGWIYVDLGQVYTLSEVKLTWETAAGKDFLIQVSNDATNWNTVQKVNGNSSLINDYPNLNARGRYVRMYGTARTTQYGYSLYEFAVYGTGSGVALTPLPVTLTYFRATAEQEAVRLQWATATEKDNKGFELERSADGRTFTTVAFVAGAGNSTTTRTYAYRDTPPAAGQLYYRLKQIDADGQSTYAPVVAVQVTGSSNFTGSCYPNPVVDRATVAWHGAASATATLRLLDGNGRAVLNRELPELAGQNVLDLDMSTYPTGLYFLTVRNGAGQVYQAKVVKK